MFSFRKTKAHPFLYLTELDYYWPINVRVLLRVDGLSGEYCEWVLTMTLCSDLVYLTHWWMAGGGPGGGAVKQHLGLIENVR